MKIKNKKRFSIIVFVILIFILIALLCSNKNQNINKQETYGFRFEVAGRTITETDNIISDNPNSPHLGAGMIPIAWTGDNWKIVDASNENNEWYNYSAGRMATVMLSDGHFVSEEQYNMKGREIATVNTQMSDNQLGTIFVWIPRIVQIDGGSYKFLKDSSIINYDKYATPTCFTYIKDNDSQYAFAGMWIQKTPESSLNNLQNRINNMNQEENNYGLIKNEIVEALVKDSNTVSSIVQKNMKKQIQQIDDIENTNRCMIRVLNTNNYTPLLAKARAKDKVATISASYTDFGVSQILYLDVENNRCVPLTVSNNKATMAVPNDGTYEFVVVDNEGNLVSITLKTAIGVPDLTGFRVDTTYLVTYEDEMDDSTIDSSVPIEQILRNGYKVNPKTNALISGEVDLNKVDDVIGSRTKWFDYDQSKWPNIVVRNNANEAYFVWIPRYVYQVNEEAQTTTVRFVDTENQDKTGTPMNMEEWTLPEAFTWDPGTGVEQITGFWTSKYELVNANTFSLNVDVIGGMEKITINNIQNGTGLGSCTYDFYVYKAGVDKTKLTDEEEMEEWLVTDIKDITDIANGHCFRDIPGVAFYDVRIVLNSYGTYMGEIWKYNIPVDQAGLPNEPEFTGFRINTTYLVAYNEDGSKTVENIPISDILKTSEEDKYKLDMEVNENTLLKGKIDFDKVNAELPEGYDWYDYSESKWANIVVRNAGGESYYTWIPRYIYKSNTVEPIPDQETTEIKFVQIDPNDNTSLANIQEYLDKGWILPEAFTWNTGKKDENGNDIIEQLNGFWASKYELVNFTNFNLKVDDDCGVSTGINCVRINNITDNLGLYNYKVYLYETAKLDQIEQEKGYNHRNYMYFAEPQAGPTGDYIPEDGSYDCSDNIYVRYNEIKGSGTNQITFDNLAPTKYTLRIAAFDDRGYYRGEKWYYDLIVIDKGGNANDIITVDLTGLRINTTYIVAYNDEGTEDASVPISEILDNVTVDTTLSENTLLTGTINMNKVKEKLPEGYVWYDYENSKWANIVVRNAGGESYYTWTPRYIYRMDNIRQETEIKFVTVNEDLTAYLNDGWTLPEAFTWQKGKDEDENPIIEQIPGFWTTKYELTGFTNFNLSVPEDSGIVTGVNNIRINNISDNLGLYNYKYKIYLYEEDKLNELEAQKNIQTKRNYKYYAEPQAEPTGPFIEADGSYDCSKNDYVRYAEVSGSSTNRTTFYNLLPKTYALRIAAFDSRGYYRGETWYYDLKVINKGNNNNILGGTISDIISVDLTGFIKDVTYYITYDDEDNEILGNNLHGSAPSNWYDYDDSKWANILVNGNDKKAYFVYIPRYIYKMDNIRQETEIKYVTQNQDIQEFLADGWVLPEAFTWTIGERTDQLKGFWTSKYELSG